MDRENAKANQTSGRHKIVKLPESDISIELIEDSMQEKENELRKRLKKPVQLKKPTTKDPKIHHVKYYILTKYELRKDIVRNVFEIKDLASNQNKFVKAENFEANITLELMEQGFTGIQAMVNVLLSSNFVKEYHPVRDYFNNLPKWDKKDRITELGKCLVVDNKNGQNEIVKHLKKHLVRCVKSAFVPNYFNKHCFVIIGTIQSMGKSTFIRKLIPKELASLTTDSVLDMKDKDANIALGTNWIINLDELANLNKNESNALKATLSRDRIKVRKPYDRLDSEIARLANFFGSTNDLEFLSDLTGNVRWICFRLKDISWDYSKLDINQIWAQAFDAFNNSKFEAELNREEMQSNEKRNKEFMLAIPEINAIQKYFSPCEKQNPKAEFASSTELMKRLNEKSYNFRNHKVFGQSLNALGFVRGSKRVSNRNNPYPIYGYYFIEETIDHTKLVDNE